MWETQTPLLTGSLVRDGQTQIRVTLMWEITTSAGILMGIRTGFGALPLIRELRPNTALFHFVPQAKRSRGRLAAKKGQPWVVTMWGKQTLLVLKRSLVRDGRRHSHIITILPMWETTTSAGILMGILRFGAIPLIQKLRPNTAPFPSALL